MLVVLYAFVFNFKTCVDLYKGNYRARNFSCKDQFLIAYKGKKNTYNAKADILSA